MQTDSAEALDLASLSDLAGVSVRTVRYYIQQGLLPAPESRGPGAHYGPEHLDRLRLIRRLQREHLPLAEIRRRLDQAQPEDIKQMMVAEPMAPSSAGDYIRSVLHPNAPTVDIQWPSSPQSSPHRSSKPPAQSQWDRISIAPDVELHVRRPLSREQNRQVDRLIDAARTIFEDNQP